MAATVELLDFLAPAVAGMSAEDKQKALDIAAGYRPTCLPEAKQDEAQAWYAAWLLYGRLQQLAGQEQGATPLPGVISEKEGDLSRTYGRADGAEDPAGFFGHYDRLAKLCRAGAITVGTRRRYGCC